MDIARLPSEILVEVTASIATRSATPLIDIVNLRRSFLSVLRRCAASGNPEASYILGLEEFCNRRKASALRHLRRAMEHGHAAAAYMIGIINAARLTALAGRH
ncbi:hypothetical protein BAE44_0003375 [Dichanthelium oligosanthes]|uniref:At2g35280-like TPR domain-containing protein n=1 Tax=Dichanthelium oligosanthes TaxID=888268 RepID=A0A1E5WE21_9POAL|nr:hypothetical protein BAE44_0003375 [Dichanthelium oligosanthes]